MLDIFRSRRLRYLALVTALLFFVFAALRVAFVLAFADSAALGQVGVRAVLETLGIGLRFDLRLALLMMLPLAVLAFVPRLNLASSRLMRGLGRLYLFAGVLAVGLLYALDFGYYDYLGLRVNASVFRFAGDAEISGQMLWQSYPIVRIGAGWLAASLAVIALLRMLERRTLERRPLVARARVAPVAFAIVVLPALIAVGLLGRVADINPRNPVPLRWSDAFFSGSTAVGALGLNPVLFVYDTWHIPAEDYDLEAVRRHYAAVAHYLGVDAPDDDGLGFARTVSGQGARIAAARAPNVVFIMLESLGASRLGQFGNPLDPTPRLDAMARDGWNFRNFYVPVSGTAKTVWASVTGIPDASREESATRNPFIARQHTLINAFEGYDKIYAIGGNAGWANMRALIQESIDGVELLEEGDWKSPNVDVWGVSDLNLFKEMDGILRERNGKRPVFAYIQTAGNHKPYTIPPDNDDFAVVALPEKEAKAAGFQSVAQYNAVRLLDYNIGRFMEMARASGYLDNTIFVLFGDHNSRISSLPFMPPAFEQLNLESVHVPGIVYAPGLLEPRTIEEAASLVDLLPSIAGMLGLDYRNLSLGRDVTRPAPEGERAVPVILREGSFPQIGVVTRSHLLRMNADGSEATLHDIHSREPLANVAQQHPETFERLTVLARGLHEASRLMPYQNRRQ